ncbi:ABC transporter ATP-binding protein [Psychrobacter phenylpyruvicus]|uniref:Methionine import ATP-binding protein MetN n=1 Tax=Psychrobacter phenylpyruvicus TaxID=29432 RepID=A0A379LKE1_9GAMM|nr:ATP-binding cassette domain-containing protein [Psychrobacter phenylpyruvicus]SUD90565.1 Methionine import ATP-binding protein MetN [Psychrobacter phenylpyruvicus]
MRLEANNLGFRYAAGPWLFRGVNLTIEPGEIVGLVGPSGSGKTTLCRILSGYEKPVEGGVTLNGSAINNRGYHPVQLVFQHPEKAVNPRWKMRKVLNEGWQPNKSLLQLLGIEEEWLNRWPNELSGGELQRFCVARALGPKTKFFIADEMTTMLDAITQAQIWQAVLERFERSEVGMLVVSHDMALVKRLCHRVVNIAELNKHSP